MTFNEATIRGDLVPTGRDAQRTHFTRSQSCTVRSPSLFQQNRGLTIASRRRKAERIVQEIWREDALRVRLPMREYSATQLCCVPGCPQHSNESTVFQRVCNQTVRVMLYVCPGLRFPYHQTGDDSLRRFYRIGMKGSGGNLPTLEYVSEVRVTARQRHFREWGRFASRGRMGEDQRRRSIFRGRVPVFSRVCPVLDR